MRRPSLSVIMSIQRRRWVANAARRESPMDAILSGNLMQSVSFLASTSVLLILAVFTGFGQIEALQASLAAVSLGHRLHRPRDAGASRRDARDLRSRVLRLHAVAAPVQPFLHHARRDRPPEHGERRRDRRHRPAQFARGAQLQQRPPRLLFLDRGGRVVRGVVARDPRQRWRRCSSSSTASSSRPRTASPRPRPSSPRGAARRPSTNSGQTLSILPGAGASGPSPGRRASAAH